MNDNGTINLKNLRKSTPVSVSPEVAPAPTSMPVNIHPSAPAAVVTPPRPPVVSSAPMPASSAPRMAVAAARRSGWKMDWQTWKKPIGIGVVASIVLLGVGYYIYTHVWTRSPFGPTPGSAEAAQVQGADSQAAASAGSTNSPKAGASSSLTVEDIIARVGKLMLLPEGETPTLAGVSDPSALGDQDFFKHAKTGDVVLMYGASRRAILYDPAANKIIEVGPITNATSTQP